MNYIPAHIQTKIMNLKADMDQLKHELLNDDLYPEDQEEIVEELRAKAWEYRVLRSNYDVLYFAYEYLSDDRNPENENNLIPAGTVFENAPNFHREL